MTHQRILSPIFLGALLLMLGGCTMLGPNFQTPEAQVPETWGEQDNELFQKPSKEESIAWWTQFNDPVLDKLVQTAYAQNLTLRSAGIRIMEARAQLGRVKGQRFPQLQEASGDLITIGTTGPSDNRYYNATSVGFDAAWEMDFWGKFRRGIESADANLLASMADYDDVLVTLTAEVARTYVNICTLEERIRLARKNTKIQEDGLRLVTDQFEAGVVTELDRLQAETLLFSTQATIPNFQATLYSNKHALAVLLGMLPDDLEKILNETEKIPTISSDIAIGAPAELLRRRPDIRRAEMQAAAQSAQIGIARADLFPSFTLFGSLGWSANDIADNSLVDIFDANSFSYSFGPAFKWNLFNYGRLKNQVRIQDARLQQLITTYQNTVLNAAREVEDSMTGIVYAKKEAEYIRQTIVSSQKSMELAMLQYEEGFVDYQRVLDSTRSMTLQQDQYAQLQGTITTSYIALYKALGGGWQIREGKEYLSQETKEQMEQRTDWGSLLSPPSPEGE
ncbi:MAG: efflux transporter outer membrane subunit [Thermodesulfobacteriota bacterium]|nr:efflux transporter outer membrane subunit [Thermodesulfobacteriota bacterium]